MLSVEDIETTHVVESSVWFTMFTILYEPAKETQAYSIIRPYGCESDPLFNSLGVVVGLNRQAFAHAHLCVRLST